MNDNVRLVESILPGLGHLRRAYGAPRLALRSMGYLLFAAAWLSVVVLRWQRIRNLLAARDAEGIVAVAFLIVFPFLLVYSAHRDLQRRVHPPDRAGLGTWALALRTFRSNARASFGSTVLGLLYFVAFLCPVLAPADPYAIPRDTATNKYLAPGDSTWVFGDTSRGEVYALDWHVDGDAIVLRRSNSAFPPPRRVPLDRLGEPRRGWSVDESEVRTMEIGGRPVPYRRQLHILGTDNKGRDLLSRIIYGSRISLTVGFAAMAVAVTLGTLFGSLAGFFGGLVDTLLMRLVDILLAFPRLLLLLLIITIYRGAGLFTIVLVLGATGWMGVARLVRAQFLQLKELDFAQAARAIGAQSHRIVFRHLLPNAMAPVIVAATLRVGDTILLEAALSFLGLGVTPPTPTWGNIVSDGRSNLAGAWWIATLPGLAIVLTVVCFNLVGDALRDALDPRGRRGR